MRNKANDVTGFKMKRQEFDIDNNCNEDYNEAKAW